MKKNFILLGILAALLLGTYLFQELRTDRLFQESLTKDHLINEDQINELKFADVMAKKKDDQWWDGKMLLSHNTFKLIVKKIAQIKKIKSVEGGDEKNYFSRGYAFEVNGERWVIGDMTLDRMGFYLKQKDKLMVAILDGESDELTDDPHSALEKKLEDLKMSISTERSALREKQLFRYYPDLPSESVVVESDGRPSFELDFKNNKTLPPPITGVEVHSKLFDKFTSLLTQMTIKQEVPFSDTIKFMKMGQVVFRNAKDKVTWELWLKSDNSADPYIVDSVAKKAYLMVGGTLKIFFIQIQDYWDKKVIPPSKFENFTKLPVTFSQGSKSAKVMVINREPLSFEASGVKIDSVQMNILFQYVFNLSEKDQADRVSQLSKSERKEILSGEHLRAEVMGQEILFWRKAEELIVVNLTQGFKSHFLIRDENFRVNFQDMIK